MNPRHAFSTTTATCAPGGVFIYADDIKLPVRPRRRDVLPHAGQGDCQGEIEADPKLRTYVANMVYVGVLAWLLGIEVKEIEVGA